MHDLYLKHCKELEELKQHKLWAAQKWYQYQLENIENVLQAEKKQAEEEHKSDLNALKERMLSNALEKKRRFIEEKNNMNLSQQGTHPHK